MTKRSVEVVVDDEQSELSRILAELKAPLPAEAIKQRAGHRDRNGKVHQVSYLEWHYVADRLDEVYPAWTNTVAMEQIGDMLVATVGLTICGVTRFGVGCGRADTDTGIKKAEHDGLKRAAIKFGLGRELYAKHEGAYEEAADTVDLNPLGFPADAVATSPQNKASDKQLGAVRAIARGLGVDPEAECFTAMNVELNAVNRKGASALIDHLKLIEAGQRTQLAGDAYMPGETHVEYDVPAPVASAPAYSGAPNGQPSGVATSLGDMITAKQIGMAKAVAREAGIDPEASCMEWFGTNIASLSKRAASDFIDKLKTYATPGAIPASQVVAGQLSGAPDIRKPMPAASPQPASAEQGKLCSFGQVKAIEKIALGIGYALEDVAFEYSNGRTRDVAQLSAAEAGDAIQKMQA